MSELAVLRADSDRWGAMVGAVARRLGLDCEAAARWIERMYAAGEAELVDVISCGATVHDGRLVYPDR